MSLLLAQALQLHNPYWVPVSCLAVIQGMSLRAVWGKQLQRLLGTSIGLFAVLGLLALPLDPWRLALMIIVLTFIVETAVVRHYGFAAIFITPLTLLLAEAVTLGHGSVSALIQARFVDTLLGCLVAWSAASACIAHAFAPGPARRCDACDAATATPGCRLVACAPLTKPSAARLAAHQYNKSGNNARRVL